LGNSTRGYHSIEERLEEWARVHKLMQIEKELLLLSKRNQELELELKALITLKPVRKGTKR
jgi:hypothetical protein